MKLSVSDSFFYYVIFTKIKKNTKMSAIGWLYMKDETCYLIDQLKEKRIEQGISQNKLAKETNMANTTVLRMENKTMDITLDKFISLANELCYL